jgi:hypothetical protein
MHVAIRLLTVIGLAAAALVPVSCTPVGTALPDVSAAVRGRHRLCTLTPQGRPGLTCRGVTGPAARPLLVGKTHGGPLQLRLPGRRRGPACG